MRNFTKLILTFLFIHLLFSINAQSVTITQGDWTDPNTWDGGVIPSAANTAIINHAVVMNGDVVCNGLEISATGSLTCSGTGILTIGSNPNGGDAALLVNGSLTMSGSCKVILRGSASFGPNAQWTMSAGYLEIDGNNGVQSTSVLDGTPLLDVSLMGAKTITGGTICFADPHYMSANFVVKGSIAFGGTNTVQIGRTNAMGVPLATNSNTSFSFDDNVNFTDLTVTYVNDVDNYLILGANTAVMGNLVMDGGKILSNPTSKFMGNITCSGSNFPGIIEGQIVCDGTTDLTGGGNLSEATLNLTANGHMKIYNNITVKDLILNNSIELSDDYATLTVTGDITGTGKVILTNPFTKLKRNVLVGTVANFPIARSAEDYAPVKIANTTAETSWEIGVSAPVNPSPASTKKVVLEWDIKPILKGTQADITVQWDEANESVGFTRNSSALYHWNGATWDRITTNGSYTTSGLTHSITKTGWSNFSPFAVFSQVSLPIELLSFTGKAQQGKALLTWATATEKNNEGFVVEKSLDGIRFDKIGFVKGNNNSNVAHDYNFLDFNFTKNAYYRLKQMDNDSYFNYSNVIALNTEGVKTKGTMQTYPNPVSDVLTVETSVSEMSQLEITDAIGRVVFKQNVESGSYQIPTSSLVNGMYIVKLSNKNDVSIQKIIKN
jgi:hypothetical protein